MNKQQDMSGSNRSSAVGGLSTTRRKFNTGAATGAAVLLTLGNRVAWGSGQHTDSSTKTTKTKTKKKKACISQRTWESYTNNNNASFDPKGKHSKEVAKFQKFLDEGFTNTQSKGDKFCAIREFEVTFEKKSDSSHND